MENYFIEKKDSDQLIIAFTGNNEELMVDTFEFFAVTNTINCNRILIKDPSKRLYLLGIGGELHTIKKLLRRIRLDIKTINPKVITMIGTSGGGFAAILFGHLLKAHFVHAFGPATHIGIMDFLKNLSWQKLKKHYKLLILFYVIRPGLRKFLDLKNVLSRYNGVTQYNIYVCEGFSNDVLAAEHLKDCKNLKILKQPCNVHNVVRCMIKNQKLFNILTVQATETITK